MQKKISWFIVLIAVALIALACAVPNNAQLQSQTYGSVEIVTTVPDSPEMQATAAANNLIQLHAMETESALKSVPMEEIRTIEVAGKKIDLPDNVHVHSYVMGAEFCPPDVPCPASGSAIMLEYTDLNRPGGILGKIMVDGIGQVFDADYYGDAVNNARIREHSQWLFDALTAAGLSPVYVTKG